MLARSPPCSTCNAHAISGVLSYGCLAGVWLWRVFVAQEVIRRSTTAKRPLPRPRAYDVDCRSVVPSCVTARQAVDPTEETAQPIVPMAERKAEVRRLYEGFVALRLSQSQWAAHPQSVAIMAGQHWHQRQRNVCRSVAAGAAC